MASKRAGPAPESIAAAAAAHAKRPRADARWVEAIPIEVLGLIFARFPLRARLRSVACVCKRWRTAAVRTMTSFCYTGAGGAHLSDVLGLLPALTHIDVRGRSESPAALPTTLRSLDLLVDIGQDSMNLISSGPLPRLVRRSSETLRVLSYTALLLQIRPSAPHVSSSRRLFDHRLHLLLPPPSSLWRSACSSCRLCALSVYVPLYPRAVSSGGRAHHFSSPPLRHRRG